MIRSIVAAGFAARTTSLPAALLVCTVAVVGLLSTAPIAAAGQSADEFAAAFKAAHEAGDSAELSKMYYFEGTPDMTQSFSVARSDTILSVTIVAAQPADSEPKVMNGNTYVPNVTVTNRMEVHYGQSGGSSTQFYVVGQTPSGDLAIGGIKLSGEASVWTAPTDGPRPATAEAFAEAFKTAYNAGDGATIQKMYFLEGTPDDVADFSLAMGQPWGTITSIDLIDVDEGPRVINGNTYVANLTNLKGVKYAGEQSSGAFRIGVTPDGYYAIAGIKRAD